MDIVAKHIQPDEYGVRIAELDEMSYRRLLWDHQPLTDFWRVGKGYEKKLKANGMFTMGDIATVSYTHLDVYKRQGYDRVIVEPSGIFDVDEFFDTLYEMCIRDSSG